MNGISISRVDKARPVLTLTNGAAPDMNGPQALRLLMATALALALFVSLMQPRGSGDLGPLAGFVFQALHLLPATGVAWWLSRTLQTRPLLARAGSGWPALAFAGALTGVALAPWSVTLEWLFGVVEGVGAAPIQTPTAWMRELAAELVAVPPITAIVWPAMALVVRVGSPVSAPAEGMNAPPPFRAPEDDHAAAPVRLVPEQPLDPMVAGSPDTAPDAPDDRRPALTSRLPATLGHDILRIEAQEHYVRIVTTRGSTLLLLGISQAVDAAAAEGIAGVRVHRSHWVALAHIERIEPTAVVASNGENVPLSRRRAARVRTAWRAAQGG